jgi:hypothetical protein
MSEPQSSGAPDTVDLIAAAEALRIKTLTEAGLDPAEFADDGSVTVALGADGTIASISFHGGARSGLNATDLARKILLAAWASRAPQAAATLDTPLDGEAKQALLDTAAARLAQAKESLAALRTWSADSNPPQPVTGADRDRHAKVTWGPGGIQDIAFDERWLPLASDEEVSRSLAEASRAAQAEWHQLIARRYRI